MLLRRRERRRQLNERGSVAMKPSVQRRSHSQHFPLTPLRLLWPLTPLAAAAAAACSARSSLQQRMRRLANRFHHRQSRMLRARREERLQQVGCHAHTRHSHPQPNSHGLPAPGHRPPISFQLLSRACTSAAFCTSKRGGQRRTCDGLSRGRRCAGPHLALRAALLEQQLHPLLHTARTPHAHVSLFMSSSLSA